MHLRNSCTRSTSACAMRQVPSGASGGRGLNGLIALLDRGSSTRRRSPGRGSSGKARIGSTVTGSSSGRSVEPRHAHQARHAVDLGRARAALAGLAVPAHGEVVGLLGLDLVDGVEHDHALGRPRSCSRWNAPPFASPRQMRKVAVRHHFISSMICFSSAGSARERHAARAASRRPAPLRTTMLNLPKRRVLVRDSRRGSGRRGSPCARAPQRVIGLGDGQQVVRGRAPCASRGCTRGCPCTRDLRARARAGRASPSSARCISSSRADDADEVLHHLLQVVLDLVRALAAAAALERRERRRAAPLDLRRRRAAPRRARCANCAAYSPARLPKTSRSESELPPSRLAPCMPAAHSPAANRPGTRRHLRVGVDAHAAHHVVRGRADLHRLLRDVDVGQLLELVVHARQLALDVLGGVRAAAS